MKKEDSLLAKVLLLIFAVAGYMFNMFVIFQMKSGGSFFYGFLTALIYIFPLLISTIDDVANVNELTRSHFVMDIIITIVGSAYIIVFLLAGIGKCSNVFPDFSKTTPAIYFFAFTPMLFVFRQILIVKFEFMQQIRFARTVYRKDVSS